jgi:hypothetical protein
MRIWVFFTTRRITCPTFPYKDFISICMVFWLLGVLVQNEPVYVDTINGCQFLGAFDFSLLFLTNLVTSRWLVLNAMMSVNKCGIQRFFHTIWSMLLCQWLIWSCIQDMHIAFGTPQIVCILMAALSVAHISRLELSWITPALSGPIWRTEFEIVMHSSKELAYAQPPFPCYTVVSGRNHENNILLVHTWTSLSSWGMELWNL